MDTLEAIVLQQVRQRAHDLRDLEQRQLAIRIANVMNGHPADGQ